MNALLVCLALAIVPAKGGPVETRVDVLELNHFYDENGRHVFDQFIFWRWNDCEGRFECIAWRLADKVGIAGPSAGVLCWFDGDRARRVRFGARRETWTQVDPELAERSILPPESRPELGK